MLVIIAVAAAGVSMAVNPQGSTAKKINKQGSKLYAQMHYALDEALFSDNAIGIVLQQDALSLTLAQQYHWYRHDGDRWQKTEAPLGTQAIAEDLSWSLVVEQLSLEESLDDLLAEAEIRPAIVFYPSGEVTDFSLEIRLPEARSQADPDAAAERYKITLDDTGQLVSYRVGVDDPEV